MYSENIKIIKLDVVSSTNDYLKELARTGNIQNTVVMAEEQTAGKGTKNRSFVSKKGGVYLSILIKPNANGFDATAITPMTAVAVRDAIEQISGINADIKWVNDLYINEKKVAGILCESVICPNGNIPYIIVGIGVNLFVHKGGFSEDIKGIATSVFEKYDQEAKVKFIDLLIENFFKYYENIEEKTFLEKYRNYNCVLAKRVVIFQGNTITEAKALAIDDNCRLIVELDDKTTKALSSGEVSIKI